MAEIQIIYREGYCEMMSSNFCTQCHTQCASDLGCSMFNEGEQKMLYLLGIVLTPNSNIFTKG